MKLKGLFSEKCTAWMRSRAMSQPDGIYRFTANASSGAGGPEAKNPRAVARSFRSLWGAGSRPGTLSGEEPLKVDEKTDALYLRLNEAAIVESEEVQPGVVLDYDEQGQVVGVELLGIRARAGGVSVRALEFEAT